MGESGPLPIHENGPLPRRIPPAGPRLPLSFPLSTRWISTGPWILDVPAHAFSSFLAPKRKTNKNRWRVAKFHQNHFQKNNNYPAINLGRQTKRIPLRFSSRSISEYLWLYSEHQELHAALGLQCGYEACPVPNPTSTHGMKAKKKSGLGIAQFNCVSCGICVERKNKKFQHQCGQSLSPAKPLSALNVYTMSAGLWVIMFFVLFSRSKKNGCNYYDKYHCPTFQDSMSFERAHQSRLSSLVAYSAASLPSKISNSMIYVQCFLRIVFFCASNVWQGFVTYFKLFLWNIFSRKMLISRPYNDGFITRKWIFSQNQIIF